MGIRGLNGIINSDPAMFQPTELRDTFLVIDGINLSCLLYSDHCRKSVLNGDYAEYKSTVQDFFGKLKQCNIFPIVILDGGHEKRKLRKTMNRMQGRINENKQINTIYAPKEVFYPTLVTEVFKDTMSDMNIFMCQDILEADVHITKVAQFLNCPVLSFDSDFYLDDVDFIPFSKFQFTKVPDLRNSDKASIAGQSYFIQSKLFERSYFLERYGGLPKLSFLPLLSFLLGNDYSNPEVYGNFFARLNGRRNPDLSEEISMLCGWFKNFDTPETAIDEFLEEIPYESRQSTREELLRCLHEKNSSKYSYLVQYIQHSLSKMVGVAAPPPTLPKIKVIERSSEWLKNAATHVSLKVNTDDKSVSHTAAKTSIPDWILEKHIQGKFPRNLMDLLHTQNFFYTLQMEDHSLPSATEHTLKILGRILGIIYKEDNVSITVYSRIKNGLESQFVKPIRSSSYPVLSEIPKLSESERQKIAFDILELQQEHKTVIPDNWRLFFLTVASWYQADNSEIMTDALGCIIFSSIFVGIIDKKLKYCETEKSFVAEYSESWKQIINKRKLQEGNSESANAISSLPSENFMSVLENVDNEDCIVALIHFIKIRNRTNSLSESQQLVKSILHRFGQLQINIQMNEILYAVLDLPSNLKIADFYCGTLAYNIYFQIKKHENLKSFIESEFNEMPTLRAVFLSAIRVVEKLSNCKLPQQMKRKSTSFSPILAGSKKPKFSSFI